MAIRGRKPNPLRLITGSHLKDRPLPEQRAESAPGGPIEKPDKIKKAPERIWDQYIARAWWLTWADGPKAIMFCNLTVEYNKNPDAMIASRLAQLRALQSELGFDQGTRDRMGITIPTGQKPSEEKTDRGKEPVSPSKKYFD